MRNSLRHFIAAVKARQTDLFNSLVVFLYGASASSAANAAGNIIVGPLCKGYNNIFDNQFIGLTAMASFTMILLKLKFSDKAAEEMGKGTKTAIALAGLLSMPEIMGWFGVQPCR